MDQHRHLSSAARWRSSILLLVASCAAGAVSAQSTGSATVNVTGNITGGCTVSGGGTVTLNIGDIPASTLTAVGSTSAASPAQNITLTCSASPGITMTLSGTRLSGSPNTVLQLSAASTAGGVGVQILNNGTGTPTTPLALNAATSIPTGATVTIPVAARYYRSAAVTAGSANTTATLNFTFN